MLHGQAAAGHEGLVQIEGFQTGLSAEAVESFFPRGIVAADGDKMNIGFVTQLVDNHQGVGHHSQAHVAYGLGDGQGGGGRIEKDGVAVVDQLPASGGDGLFVLQIGGFADG